MMVFCCGCTLRFATQFLLWTELAIDCIWFLYSTAAFIFYIRNIEDIYFEYYYGYYMLWSAAGIITIVLGVWAINKKKPLFLNGFLYYLHYYVCFETCCVIILLIWPSVYKNIFNHTFRKVYFVLQLDISFRTDVILITMWYSFLIANLIYFVIVVKTYRDNMLKNKPYCDDISHLDGFAQLSLKSLIRRDRTLTL